MVNSQTPVKEHQWERKTSHNGNFWEERRCPVCGLENRSERSAREKQWRVTTPCIEPVTEPVAYADLCEEFKKNDVREKAVIILNPNYCTAGFLVGSQGIHIYPNIKAGGPEQIKAACAELFAGSGQDIIQSTVTATSVT